MLRLNRDGFTLVEIMIVVTIVGLLAAIAIPNYVNARREAAQQVCITNLRQLDGTMLMYRSDNGVWADDLGDLAPYLKSIPTTCPLNDVSYVITPSINGRPAYVSCPNHGGL